MIVKQLGSLINLSLLELYRRKDVVVLVLLSLFLVLPMAAFKPFGISGTSRYLNEIALLLIWIFSIVISLTVSSRAFPPEFESRTIYPLLSKPVNRSTVLLGKYFGAFVASLSALILFYFMYWVLDGWKSGVWLNPTLLQAFFMHVACIAVLCAISILGSLLVTPSANITLCAILAICMLLFGQRIPVYIETQTSIVMKYFLSFIQIVAPHIEFFDLRQRCVHDWGCVNAGICAIAWLYALVYSSICLFLASVALKRKRM